MPNADDVIRGAQSGHPCPPDWGAVARTLYLAKAGDWEGAHDLCQDLPDPAGAWIHAWLHRQEGDYGNACYWYARAGKPAKSRQASIDDEWLEIARHLLDGSMNRDGV